MNATTQNAADKAKEAAQSAADKARDVAGQAKDAAGNVIDKAKDLAGQAVGQAKDAASHVGKSAEHAATSAGSTLKDLGNTIQQKGPQEGVLGSASHTVGKGLQQGGQYLEEQGLSGVVEDLTEVIKRNPLPAVLIGLGLGLIVGRALRS